MASGESGKRSRLSNAPITGGYVTYGYEPPTRPRVGPKSDRTGLRHSECVRRSDRRTLTRQMLDEHDQSDTRLLDAWRRSRDRAAMDRLIRRHVHFVYGAARRILGDAYGAEDVTQAVFMLLIQKSPRLPSDPALAVWLHRTTRYACANARKMQQRREVRELRVANQTREPEPMTDEIDYRDERDRLLPLLDEAITHLGERDRSGVILCYFQRRTFREIGALLGTSEDAARKRVSRSVDRIREYFLSRGVALSSTAGVAPIVGRAHERIERSRARNADQRNHQARGGHAPGDARVSLGADCAESDAHDAHVESETRDGRMRGDRCNQRGHRDGDPSDLDQHRSDRRRVQRSAGGRGAGTVRGEDFRCDDGAIRRREQVRREPG